MMIMSKILPGLLLLFLFGCQPTEVSEVPKEDNVDHWAGVDEILANIKAPTFPDQTFNITENGAVADGETDCLPAIKAAINACAESDHSQQALDFFQKGGSNHVQWNTIIYKAAINACEKGWQGQHVLQISGRLRRKHM